MKKLIALAFFTFLAACADPERPGGGNPPATDDEPGFRQGD